MFSAFGGGGAGRPNNYTAHVSLDCSGASAVPCCIETGSTLSRAPAAMDFLRPFTRLVEMVWCAATVSGLSSMELLLFLVLLGMMGTLMWNMWVWQKRITLMIQSVQTQLQDQVFFHQRQRQELEQKLLGELYEQCEVLTQFFQPANMMFAQSMVMEQLTEHIRTASTTVRDGADGSEDNKQVLKQLLEVTAKLASLQAIATEVSAVHKAVNTHMGDFCKLTTIAAKATETHGLLLQVNGDLVTKKDIAAEHDRTQGSLNKKLDELVEKTTVLRVIVDQHRDKILAQNKEGHGWSSKLVSDALSLLRGLGPVVPQLKALHDMVYAGKEASQVAQDTLSMSSDAIQNCEDRLVRLESLATGIVDQQNETDANLRANFEQVMSELPAIQEVLTRLPKLPTRKPPTTDRQPPDMAASSSTGLPSHPTTPPTTLGPAGLTAPPMQPSPTVIPVQLDGTVPTQGIQLRLSEHVGAITPQAAQPQLLVSGNTDRANNYLITPIPNQSMSSGDLLRAVLR